jgi:hypothetical protein
LHTAAKGVAGGPVLILVNGKVKVIGLHYGIARNFQINLSRFILLNDRVKNFKELFGFMD